jgi:LDH2 family malate/lactate/ureidoglycolate dehydrogenase
VTDYIALWKAGRLNSKPNIRIIHETPSTAVIDGDQCAGMMAGLKAMETAMQKAKSVGTGWVSVQNSNHFGIAGFYAMMALKEDMIGICMTNANPLVAPTFSVDRMLGTNPIAVAVPAGNEPPFVADFATTPIARGKLDLMHKKGLKAPLGFVQDKTGKPSDNPNILTEGGAILPLGSDREHGSHKGYCMGAIVDIFSAVLSGAGFGPFVPPSVAYLPVIKDAPGHGTGHFFGAMRIDAFRSAEEFKITMDQWIQTFRRAKPVEGYEKVLIPGDIERDLEEKYIAEGIPVLNTILEKVNEMGKEFGVSLEIETNK